MRERLYRPGLAITVAALVRVCVLVHQFPVRSETFIVNHAAELLRRGHDVVIVPLTSRRSDPWAYPPEVAEVVRATEPTPGALPERGVAWVGKVAALATRGLTRHRRRWSFAVDEVGKPAGRGHRLLVAERVARGGPFDVIHAQFGTTASAAVGLARHGITRAPIVCSIHGQDANVTARTRGEQFAAAVPHLDCVTVGTAFMAEVVRDLGVPREKITLWPQGVDTARPISARRGIHETFNVLSVGRLVEFKGVDDSLRVVAAARRRVPNLRYTVIGDGPRRADLEQLARDLGVADITTFAGAQDHASVLAAHADADVFLQMGKTGADGSREGQGVAPCEAAVSGLPCVATRSGGLPEVILDAATGVLVDPGDVGGATAALTLLAADPGRRRDMGEAGRRFVSERFSLSATTDVIEAVYAALDVGNKPSTQ